MNKLVALFFVCFELSAQTICLNMIVKNEAHIIKRCLGSVKDLIDAWVIVDTGSTDGTQEIIKEFLKDIPGELYERPWVDFAHNRNEALELAKPRADYLLFIDADETFLREEAFRFPELNLDYYLIVLKNEEGDINHRVALVKSALGWKWDGVLHESIGSLYGRSYGKVEGIEYLALQDGCRSLDPQKHYRDIELLKTALGSDPGNARYVYYLAQSYWNAKEFELSLQYYEKRAAMGGWEQEVYVSKLLASKLRDALNLSWEKVVHGYSLACQANLGRAEPFYHLSSYLGRKSNPFLAYLLSQYALSIPMTTDLVYVERWVYDYGLLWKHAIDAFQMGKYEEAALCCQRLLEKKNLPDAVLKNAEMGLQIASDPLSLKTNLE